ncbi:LysM peptidoglycan-binding domain-containing protein [Halobacillus mangrovi]|uniref:3D domain-containing protein n=1 Tax=Halobacillus mangrovi TaxID=402384 RepID=UPI003D9939B9
MKKTVFSLAAVSTIMAATTVTASAEEVVVNKGDTLWSIAQDKGVSVEQIKQENNLSSNLIFPDQTLNINEEKSEGQASGDTHTVKSGDTLWSIGQDYEVSVDELQAWNGLDSALIHPGDKLSVEGQAVAGERTSNSSSENEEQEAPEQTSSEDQSSDDNVAKTFTAEATAYTANCEGCSGTTYTGIDLKANPDRKVIAVDPDVVPLGSEVYVEGYGKAIAGDIGGAIDGNRIDVFIPNQSDALDFGRKQVEVTVYE